MAVKDILLLGDPRLYEVSQEVAPGELDYIKTVVTDLHDTMMTFRHKHGFGRAIAAPQIGVLKRLIYMHTDSPTVIINPVLSNLSEDILELWDDCMSFPDLLVRVRRHRSAHVEFRDLRWKTVSWHIEGDLSELIQHEYDHLDGILAVERAIDGKSFALRLPPATNAKQAPSSRPSLPLTNR